MRIVFFPELLCVQVVLNCESMESIARNIQLPPSPIPIVGIPCSCAIKKRLSMLAVFFRMLIPRIFSSGRMKCIGAHQHLIDHINQFEGVRWCTLDEMADAFLKRNPK